MNKKGFIKTIFLFILLIILLLIGYFIFLGNKEEIGKAKNDLKASWQEKKENVVEELVKEGKNSLGETLKNTGEKMINKE